MFESVTHYSVSPLAIILLYYFTNHFVSSLLHCLNHPVQLKISFTIIIVKNRFNSHLALNIKQIFIYSLFT